MKKYGIFTAKEVKPTGWLRRQLELQANGLSGHLDLMWPDIRDSAWVGGNADDWERVPYWLDGFVPLAYLLEDDDLIRRAKKYIDAIIARQEPSGWVCPCPEEKRAEYDTWAVELLSKALTVYYECSGDERMPEVIYKMMKNYYDLLKSGAIELIQWAKYRWFEAFISLNFLYERYGEEWICDLARIMDEQGFDYRTVEEDWKIRATTWSYEMHIVNLTMILKIEAVTDTLLDGKYKGLAKHHYDLLTEYNGTPVAIYTGDECLSGLSPVQGTELCAVAEQMFSAELLYAYTGDKKWADMLEEVAFNALPATISDDMWTHQYDQLSNQMAVVKFPDEKVIFNTNGQNAHLFGVEPHYGCCTANFNQAWPKFAASVYMYDGDKIVSAMPVPATLTTDGVKIETVTDYPFKNTITYKISAEHDFKFSARVPSFADGVKVNGEAVASSDMLDFDITAGETEITVEIIRVPRFVERPYDLTTVKYGSLTFSVPIKMRENRIEYTDTYEHKYPYCDFEFYPESEWRYGYYDTELAVEEHEVDAVPFSSKNPAVTIKANVARIDWKTENGFEWIAGKVPTGRKALTDPEKISLYPYASAKLRMTEIPMIEK